VRRVRTGPMSTDAPRVLSPTREIRLVKNALIPMSDNARLAADLYLPAEAHDTGIPTPVVPDYIPYRKDEVRLQGWGAWFYERLVAGGYAVARVDIRGTGGSDGVATDEYVEQEQLDGCEVIAWLAQQPWCDGN